MACSIRVSVTDLADELLALCIGPLPLRSLSHVSRVNRHWQQTAQRAFAHQLRWRAEARSSPLPLPVPAVPAFSSSPSPIRKTGVSLAYLRDDLVAQIVDAEAAAVRTVRFFTGDGGAPLKACEEPPREFADHGPFNAGVGGIVGYRGNGRSGFTFFPATQGAGGEVASTAVWVAKGEWQNVLHAGHLVFLLRPHGAWWGARADRPAAGRITADVLDTGSGGSAVVDVTPLRNALRRHVFALDDDGKPDRPARAAVSAVDGHFIFHLHTAHGAKVAGALRLPAHVAPQGVSDDSCQEAGAAVVTFARRWPASHPIAQMRAPDEKPCGEYLMLWEDRNLTLDGKVDVVLLCARTGTATARELIAPILSGSRSEGQQSVASEFHRGGIAAIDYAPVSGVVAACSLPRPGLPPPAVLLWDWESAACLNAVHLPHGDPAPPLRGAVAPTQLLPGGYRPLRFAVGARVECCVGQDLWVPGTVAVHYPQDVDEEEWADQMPRPYLVHLDSDEMVSVPVDHFYTIRAEGGGGEDVQWNSRTEALEVAAASSLVLHPLRSRLAVGMWHYGSAAGVLYSIDFGGKCFEAPGAPAHSAPSPHAARPRSDDEEGIDDCGRS